MTLRLSTGLAAILLASLGNYVSRAGEEKKQEQPQADQAALEKLYADFAALEPEHAQFKKLVGRWKAVNKMWTEGSPEPVVTEGTTSFRLLMGGRFLQQKYDSEFEGRPYEGMGISGYDKAKKKYVGIWIDNMSTSFMTSEGQYDADTKTMTDIGEAVTPMGPMTFKTVSKELDRNTHVFTMYMVEPDGKEQKHMEITYTRLPRAKKKKQ